jgi:hypothetical protein
MNPQGLRGVCATAALALGWLSVPAIGQQQSPKEQLVGTWTLISWSQMNADGTSVQQFGINPKGGAFFDAGRHYIISVMRADRAKYAIADFGQIAQATADENKATAQGTITYFGTYSVNEADLIIAMHVEASSVPNWNGTDLTRFFEITEDQLKLTVRPPRGGTVDVLWKRTR